MANCSQCGKPAVVLAAGNPLCVDCNLKLQQAISMRHAMLAQQMNFLLDEAEAVTGIYGVMPRYRVPQPIIHQGTMNFHNIRIDKSVVGAINTGHVQQIDVALSHIKLTGDPELEKSLAGFTEAVANSTALSAVAKNELLEQIAVVAEQAAMPKESRSWGILKALVTSIGTQAAVAGLGELWDKIKPMLGL